MILKLPENRKIILEYLNRVNEDSFIEEFIIPFFASQGYQVYRQNIHGPGEHGKDIIFSRYIPIFFEKEYIAVQAKAEKATAGNVSTFSKQMERAYKVGFPTISGNSNIRPHYAVFINARQHTNDATVEFPQLLDNRHGIILSQENVCELIMQTGIAPRNVLDKLSIRTEREQDGIDKEIFRIILGDNPSETDKLLDHQLKYYEKQINQETKDLILDYINDRWEHDSSWEGTIKPMKWFNKHFNLFTEKHGKYLLRVLEELTSTNPSYKALADTLSVVRKIKPDLLVQVEHQFVKMCAYKKLQFSTSNIEYLYKLLDDYLESGLIKEEKNKRIAYLVLHLEKERIKSKYKEMRDELFSCVYPQIKT